ncbi:neuromodulin isoform X2 [Parasteatoda tepidariorum]|uniref:neuromodulin isoform X2 n=1 Tax=Parasteatoda tepidariorum TaxID=114398 RepID=UPI0039BD5234
MGCNVSKDVKVEDNNGGDRMSEEKAAEKIQASFRGYKTRKSLKNNGLLPAVESGATLKEEKVASTIQNSHKNVIKKEESNENTTDKKVQEEEEVDIDLGDPDVEKAALKIQHTFRGYKSRNVPQE